MRKQFKNDIKWKSNLVYMKEGKARIEVLQFCKTSEKSNKAAKCGGPCRESLGPLDCSSASKLNKVSNFQLNPPSKYQNIQRLPLLAASRKTSWLIGWPLCGFE